MYRDPVRSILLPGLLAAGFLTATAAAQAVPLIPYSRTMDLLVVDASYDGVWRCIDWNQDGDLLDANEVVSFYSDQIGTIALTNPSSISTARNGTVYIGDSSADVIVALQDLNGDGNANGAGEHQVFFDASNASGIVMASLGGLYVDRLGRIFGAVANTGSGGTDVILIFEDLNSDGDANDIGEARDYHTVPGLSGTGDSIPTEVLVAADLNVYYAEAGATGVVTKGIYKLSDNNFDGDCNDTGERSLFWDTSMLGLNSPFHFGMAVDASGRFYITDHSANEQVWSAFDSNGNGTIELGEFTLFYQTSASTWWDIVIREDGTVLLCEDQTPDRITQLRDLNGDGDAMDAGEAIEIYDDTLASNPSLRPRGAALMRAPLLTVNPGTVPFGQTVNFLAETSKPVELAAVFLTLGVAGPVSLPPFGSVEIDTSALLSLGLGVSDSSGIWLQPFTVPNTPAAIGTFAAQAICGDGFRLFLSNAVSLTVTP